MLEKIKQFFFLLGIFSLIAVFYITKKKLELNKLKGLLKKDYDNKLNKLKKEQERLSSKVTMGDVNRVKKDIVEITEKKNEIKDNIKNLESDDLVSAVDTWFKSRGSVRTGSTT